MSAAAALAVAAALTIPAPAAAGASRAPTVAPAMAVADSPVTDSAVAGEAVAGVSPALASAALDAGISGTVLELGLRAYDRVRSAGLSDRPILTIVDYSRLSREPRLWVLDVASGEVLARELVAHGRNTGGDVARSFSNREGSYQSSIGTFVTRGTYVGKHGRSLRLRGLDDGLNDNAEARAIVVHGADYVNGGIVKQLGRLGRSLGCPALSQASAQKVIDLIRDGTTFFAYYPSDELELSLR